MELEPGYIVREEMPFGPPVATDGLFEGLADELTGVLADSDGALASTSAAVGDDVPQDIDAHYARTAGVAEEVTDDEIAAGSQSQADPLLTSGGAVDQLRGGVVGYLPQPDAPIDGNFIDPPDPNLIGTGRGFNSIGGGDDGSPGGGGGGDINVPPDPATIRESVRQLYLTILQREPDPQGWDDWSAYLEQPGHTLAQVNAAFYASDEYKQLHGG